MIHDDKDKRIEPSDGITDQQFELVAGGGDTITVPDGYVMRYRFDKLIVTKEMVLDKLLDLDPKTCRAGDLRDIQNLARIVSESPS